VSSKISSLVIAILITLTATQQVLCAGLTVFGPEDFETSEWHFKLARRTFSVDDPGDGIIKVTKTDSEKVPDGGFLIFNFRLIPLRKFFTGDDLVFEKDVPIKSYNRMLIFFRGAPGTSIQISVSNEEVQIPPPEVTVAADPLCIMIGEASVLAWETSYADTVSIDNGIGAVAQNGSLEVMPQETTTYNVVAAGSGGVSSDSVTITVTMLPPEVEIIAYPETIVAGQITTLSWTSSWADSCVIEPDIGVAGTEGSLDVAPEETTTYSIVAESSEGTATDSVTVIVTTPEPEVYISVEPDTVVSGEEALLTWSSEHADSCIIEPDIGAVYLNGSTIITPVETTTYEITAIGPGGTQTAATTVFVPDPPTAEITADPEIILIGDSTELTWTTTNADTVSIDNDIGDVQENGTIIVSPEETTTYTLTAEGQGGTISAEVTVTVNYPLPTVSIQAEPATIQFGESVTLTWSSTNTFFAIIDNGIGDVSVNGSITVTPAETISYTITVTGAGGTRSAGVLVTVVDSSAPPEVSISADPESVTPGGLATLSWTSVNAESVYIDNDIGSVSKNGSVSVSLNHTTSYTISATGPSGSASADVIAMVIGNPEPQSEGSFGKQYEDIIPADATVESYDENRLSIITGLVQNTDGTPIQDVDVIIHDHPEYGTVKTDVVGRFSIPVEGGSVITVKYTKQGLISTHRKVHVPWNDIAITETVQMIAEDPISTNVTFDGNPETVVTHQGTDITDEFGTRSCTMVFTGDNKAFLVDENGSDVHELTTITTCSTEYTTPESMPAKLPPTSAYTYCVELSVDGAERVRFDKPVTSYVNNFLGFDVGEIVPVGSYDRDRGVWIPEDNGVVVGLLDTDSDGVVDALDADGDGQPDDLDESGSFSDEVTGLDNPLSYKPGNTYWRFQATHFTPWDCNWASGAILVSLPNPDGVPIADQQTEEPCETPCGSHVDDRGRILHEDISIPGTDMTLHYASNRAKGYETVIDVPASGENVPDTLKRILVQVSVSGRTFEKAFDPLPNQKAIFVWDGLDHLGKRVKKPAFAHIKIGFVYDAIYYSADGISFKAFGRLGTEITGIRARFQIVLWKRDMIPVTPSYAVLSNEIAEGWAMSSNHSLNLLDLSTLYKGDGTKLQNNLSIIQTVAGIGDSGYSGDGGPATEALFFSPSGIAIDATGNLFIADTYNHRIRKIDKDGIITTLAGTGSFFDGFQEGALATEVHLAQPEYVTTDPEGNLYVTNYARVYKINPSGVITTFAGKYPQSFSGDGGPATEAGFNEVQGIAADAYGSLYIADYYNNRIRKVDPDGIITTFAGTGEDGYSGDEGPATEAGVKSPRDIVVDVDGNIYIASDNRIRKIDTSGIITTIAGTGEFGDPSGDGGPAIEAIVYPFNLAIDAKGNFYFSNVVNASIRKVDTSGIITTVAGTGEVGNSGDGDPAILAKVFARGLAIDNSGNIVFTTDDYNSIRKVGPASLFSGVTEIGDIPFADASGLVYIMDSTSSHKKTIDLETQQTLYTFSPVMTLKPSNCQCPPLLS